VVFYLHRSRMVSLKDLGRHEGEDSSRHAGGDVADRRFDDKSEFVVVVVVINAIQAF
jgi:hypothetical protein